MIVGLDSMCSHHLFIDKTDFVSDIKPIIPFEIHGAGRNIKAIWFYWSSGILYDKLLLNAYYAPIAPVWLISLLQLGGDTGETSTLWSGGIKSIFPWNFYSQVISQLDHLSFFKAIVKDMDNLYDTSVWQLQQCSELGDI
jgi:hypothetical protein